MSGLDRALVEIARVVRDGAIVRDPDVLDGYATDASEVAPHRPEAVVRASSAKDVAAVLRAASAHLVPVTPRAGGTGRVGGAVPLQGGIVLSMEAMRGAPAIDGRDLVADVEPGVITGALHQAVEAEGLFYPPDPNSLETCAIGGNLATNAGGPRAFKYGVTRSYVLGLEAVLPDGTIVEVGRRTIKGVTGYDLASLLVGSEGTLAVITRATLRLIAKPEGVRTLLVFFDAMPAVAAAIESVIGAGIVPRCMELLDPLALALVRAEAGIDVPAGAGAMLLVELDGDDEALGPAMETTGQRLLDAGALEVLVAKHEADRARLWSARRELSHTLRRQARFKLAEDVVVPRSRIGDLLARCRVLSEKHGITMPTYGHAGDGNLHVNFLWNDERERPAVDAAIRALFEEVVAMRGTLSGEHGIGVLKAPYLPLEQSPAVIGLQRRIKSSFDPKGILNPGKIFAGERAMHGGC